MQSTLNAVGTNEMDSLVQASETAALMLTKSICLQLENQTLLIAKRIGWFQARATLKLGDEGMDQLIHEIKIWVRKLPRICMNRIYKSESWPHRCVESSEQEGQYSIVNHIPGTPTGAEFLTWSIYQILCELGELLTRYGFNTNDIGALHNHGELPHLGVLLRFPWSNEMKTLFTAYRQDLDAVMKMRTRVLCENVYELREAAYSMWDAV